MAAVVPNPLRISNPFTATRNPPPSIPRPSQHRPSPPPRAAADDDDSITASDEATPITPPPTDTSFDSRLSQVRLKYRSGTGKKAEQRKAKKSGSTPAAATKKGSVMLPPVSLREPVSAGGMAVEVGFTPYSEWLNGRLAGLGLAALLLVELGSGKGLFAYHSSAIIFVQVYTVAAAAAVFVKYEKERISVWPKAAPPSSSD